MRDYDESAVQPGLCVVSSYGPISKFQMSELRKDSLLLHHKAAFGSGYETRYEQIPRVRLPNWETTTFRAP